jgi:hypothetical protein
MVLFIVLKLAIAVLGAWLLMQAVGCAVDRNAQHYAHANDAASVVDGDPHKDSPSALDAGDAGDDASALDAGDAGDDASALDAGDAGDDASALDASAECCGSNCSQCPGAWRCRGGCLPFPCQGCL